MAVKFDARSNSVCQRISVLNTGIACRWTDATWPHAVKASLALASVSHCVIHTYENLIQGRRIVANAHAGSVVDGVGDRGGRIADAKLADAFDLQRVGPVVALVQEQHVERRHVGIDRQISAMLISSRGNSDGPPIGSHLRKNCIV